jgi:uncharacterized membrane protein
LIPHEATSTSPAATYARALTLGVVTGLRSMTGLAALALAAQPERPHPLLAHAPSPWRLLATRQALAGFGLAAAGEYVGDKLPFTPGRLQPLQLTGRLCLGAIAGAIVCRAAERSPVLGAMLGALGALGGSLAGYRYRTELARRLGAPDLPLALAEDAIAIVVALAVTK